MGEHRSSPPGDACCSRVLFSEPHFTGPLVALFDPADGSHAHCVRVLQSVDEPLATTIPVLTEAFHLLRPGSAGAQRLMDLLQNPD